MLFTFVASAVRNLCVRGKPQKCYSHVVWEERDQIK